MLEAIAFGVPLNLPPYKAREWELRNNYKYFFDAFENGTYPLRYGEKADRQMSHLFSKLLSQSPSKWKETRHNLAIQAEKFRRGNAVREFFDNFASLVGEPICTKTNL